MFDSQNLFQFGLCRWTTKLYWQSKISYEERRILLDYIEKNAPLSFIIRDFCDYSDGYYWKSGNIKPRLRWLKKHINKH
jgi:hypothetical protein